MEALLLKQLKKSHISRDEVEHVAWLAHIELTEEEKEVFTEQFNRILGFFKKIDEADTERVPPTYHVLDLINIQRADEAGESLPKEEPLKNAPRKEERFFKSPRIV
jgi:aspartyl-tRNA(Asn)/glutamyl-tRNA(Gln) amidotransferase subunit C